jgi:hypothetical protein
MSENHELDQIEEILGGVAEPQSQKIKQAFQPRLANSRQ